MRADDKPKDDPQQQQQKKKDQLAKNLKHLNDWSKKRPR